MGTGCTGGASTVTGMPVTSSGTIIIGAIMVTIGVAIDRADHEAAEAPGSCRRWGDKKLVDMSKASLRPEGSRGDCSREHEMVEYLAMLSPS
jgi:hypothetical protein